MYICIYSGLMFVTGVGEGGVIIVLIVSHSSYLNSNFTCNIDIENVCLNVCTAGEMLIN